MSGFSSLLFPQVKEGHGKTKGIVMIGRCYPRFPFTQLSSGMYREDHTAEGKSTPNTTGLWC